MFIFPNFFFGDKVQKIQEIKQGAPATDKTETSSRPANQARLNEIIQMAESAKQKEKDLNAKVDELAKAVKCANTLESIFCDNTLRTLARDKKVAESLITLSKSIPIVITVHLYPFGSIYVSSDGWLIITEEPDIEGVKKFLGVK